MAGPICPKCGGEKFDYDYVKTGRHHLVPGTVVAWIIYCAKCGHIVGCVGDLV